MAHVLPHSHKHSFHRQVQLQRAARQPAVSLWAKVSGDSSLWVSLIMLAFGVGLIGYALLEMDNTASSQPRDAASISYD